MSATALKVLVLNGPNLNLTGFREPDIYGKKPLEDIDARLEIHRNWLRRGIAEGHFLVAGRRIPRVGGIILINAATEDEARALAETDPFISSGLAEFELFAWEPTLRSTETPENWGPRAQVIASVV